MTAQLRSGASDGCARVPRCAAERLACSQFAAYTEHRTHWHVLPRVDAGRAKYERALGKAQPRAGSPVG